MKFETIKKPDENSNLGFLFECKIYEKDSSVATKYYLETTIPAQTITQNSSLN